MRTDQTKPEAARPMPSQTAAVAKADAWTAAQAARLSTDAATIKRAIRCAILAEQIEQMSAAAFLAMIAGRSTVPKDRHQIATLQKLREFYKEPHGAHERSIPGTMRAGIEQYHRDQEAARRDKRRAA